MSRLMGLAGIAVALLLVGAGLALFVLERVNGPGPLAADTVVFVAPGTGTGEIARQLEADGVIENALMFRAGVRLLGASKDLKAGEYLFPANVSMRDVVDLLRSGKTVMRRLTLPEGITSTQAAVMIQAAPGLDGELESIPPEGSLLPETYHYERGDKRSVLVARMRTAQQEALAELWATRAPGLPLATPEEAVILASVVEMETGLAAERPVVASVFVNRLKDGMRLQSDPTVAYGITHGTGPLGRTLTRKDLQTPSDYNTYLIDGLPPGPIANPGRASLEAVLKPAETEFRYFVASGDGGHAFAKTLEEHNRNVAKWRQLNKEQAQ